MYYMCLSSRRLNERELAGGSVRPDCCRADGLDLRHAAARSQPLLSHGGVQKTKAANGGRQIVTGTE